MDNTSLGARMRMLVWKVLPSYLAQFLLTDPVLTRAARARPLPEAAPFCGVGAAAASSAAVACASSASRRSTRRWTASSARAALLDARPVLATPSVQRHTPPGPPCSPQRRRRGLFWQHPASHVTLRQGRLARGARAASFGSRCQVFSAGLMHKATLPGHMSVPTVCPRLSTVPAYKHVGRHAGGPR